AWVGFDLEIGSKIPQEGFGKSFGCKNRHVRKVSKTSPYPVGDIEKIGQLDYYLSSGVQSFIQQWQKLAYVCFVHVFKNMSHYYEIVTLRIGP
ncbi:MAG: hypothetical protein QMC36_06055, partial [Patescibacteria group bacterium]